MDLDSVMMKVPTPSEVIEVLDRADKRQSECVGFGWPRYFWLINASVQRELRKLTERPVKTDAREQ